MASSIPQCCVCDRPIEGEGHWLGKRQYCATHYERLARENKAAAGPILFSIAGVAVFVAVVAVAVEITRPTLTGGLLVLVGAILALVPAAFWILAFYRQDRLEPEPKHYVLGVFLAGGLLAHAIGQPLIRDVFRVQEWVGADLATMLLGSILVVGFVQESLKYAAIRYTVFRSQEFDERVDGIIYGAAAGLGYATLLNIQYVVSNGGVDLGVGAIHAAVTALAQGAFSGVVGYFLGRAKFESMGPLWLPAGIALAATLNGVTNFVLDEIVNIGGLDFNPWYGLVAAVLIAGGTFGLLFVIVRRLNAAAAAATA